MLTGDRMPAVSPETPLPEALAEMNRKNIGAVLVVSNEKTILGILTDGDIRRLVVKSSGIFSCQVGEVMTPSPKTIQADLLAADALSIMQRHEVTILAVVNHDQQLVGILHLHDLLGKGEFRVLI